jgi:hypothetical protein
MNTEEPSLPPDVIAAANKKAEELGLKVSLPPKPYIIKVSHYINEKRINLQHNELISGERPPNTAEYLVSAMMTMVDEGTNEQISQKQIVAPIVATDIADAFSQAPVALEAAGEAYIREQEEKAKNKIARERLTHGLQGMRMPRRRE